MAKRLVEIKDKVRKTGRITWKVQGSCNHSCSYCHPANYAGPRTTMEEKDYHFFLKLFGELRAKGVEDIKFFFTGGEPSLWKPLDEFCRFLKDNVDPVRLGINSNMSLPVSWWKKHYHYFDDVVASFHIEQVNKKRFLENIVFLQDKVNHLIIRLMMVEDRRDEIFEFAEEIKKNCFNYRIEYTAIMESLTPQTAPWSYKDKEFEKWINETPIETKIEKPVPSLTNFEGVQCVYDDGSVGHYDSGDIINTKQNFFKGWECELYRGLYIDEFGGIHAGSCKVMAPLGNMYKGTLNMMEKPIVCPKDYCHCGADISFPKRDLKHLKKSQPTSAQI